MELLSSHLWWIAAVIVSLVKAGFMLASQYMKVDGTLTVFWRGLIPFLVLTPCLFFIEIPTSLVFYSATCATALIASYTDIKAMNGAIKFGAGVSLRLMPYSLWGVFFVWVVVSPIYRESFLAQPMLALGVMGALMCAAIGSTFLRKCTLSKEAFIFFAPVLVCSIMVDVLNKTAMDSSSVLGGIIMYGWLQGVIVSFVCLVKQVLVQKRSISTLFEKRVMYAGLLIGGGFLFANIFKNTAMTFTINPAYVSAIILLSPIWTSLFYRLKGEKEQANEWAGLLVVASSIMLVILASNM